MNCLHFLESPSHAVLDELGERRVPQVVLLVFPLELDLIVLGNLDRQATSHEFS